MPITISIVNIKNLKTEIYKTKLEEEKKLLEEELGSISQLDKTTGEWEAVPEEESAPLSDESDMSDRSEDYIEKSAITETLDNRLEDINRALSKIGSESYGICESCGNKIEEDRLEANPAARTCKACMEKVV